MMPAADLPYGVCAGKGMARRLAGCSTQSGCAAIAAFPQHLLRYQRSR